MALDPHFGFLLTASELLATSLDFEATLTNTVHLVTSHLADICVVCLSDEAQSVKVACTSYDRTALPPLTRELLARYPHSTNKECGVLRVIQTGKPHYAPKLPTNSSRHSPRTTST